MCSHVHQHALHTQYYRLHCLCTQQQEAQLANVDGVKVLWCHSNLVWLVYEGSITSCACFRFKTFRDSYRYMQCDGFCFASLAFSSRNILTVSEARISVGRYIILHCQERNGSALCPNAICGLFKMFDGFANILNHCTVALQLLALNSKM